MLEQWKRYMIELFEWLGEANYTKPEHLLIPVETEEPRRRERR
jgi:hypothetical protein